MSQFGPIVPSAGPLNAEIVLLAEAPGSEETEQGQPLVGPSGRELRRMCRTVGLDFHSTFRCNVFSRQPDQNNLALYGGGPKDMARGPLTLNPITHVNPEHNHDLARLATEIASIRPNIIVALGNTATWFLGLGLGIKDLRGNLYEVSILGQKYKVLPTYHPAAVLRQWDQRVVAIADLQKALNESYTPTLTFDNTTLWLDPTLEDLVDFDYHHMARSTVCAVDIETARGQITCISFAPSVEHSLCIPFRLKGDPPNYWPDAASEAQAWGWVRTWMERKELAKVFQNGTYDLQYLARLCCPMNCLHDTMLAHHSLFSELPKSLGFLGSVYAQVPAWKKMRKTDFASDQFKRDE